MVRSGSNLGASLPHALYGKALASPALSRQSEREARVSRAGIPGGKAMKTTILAAALAAATLGLGSAAAGQAPIDAGVYRTGDAQLQRVALRAHTCTARSVVAVGYWTSTSLAVARRRALVQCAVRTPRAYNCLITRCT